MSSMVFAATPENTINGCSFSMMTTAILDIVKDGKNSLYITGHRLQNFSLQNTLSSWGISDTTSEHIVFCGYPTCSCLPHRLLLECTLQRGIIRAGIKVALRWHCLEWPPLYPFARSLRAPNRHAKSDGCAAKWHKSVIPDSLHVQQGIECGVQHHHCQPGDP